MFVLNIINLASATGSMKMRWTASISMHAKRPHRSVCRWSRLVTILLCCTLLGAILTASVASASDDAIRSGELVNRGESEGSSPGANRTSATTKLQARISLESNNLDLIGEQNNYEGEQIEAEPAIRLISNERIQNEANRNVNNSSNSNSNSQMSNQKANTTTTTSSGRRPGVKKLANKSSRQLSNIWSMFLPGSSKGESSDYESGANESAGDDQESNNVDNEESSGSVATTTTAPTQATSGIRQADIVPSSNQAAIDETKKASAEAPNDKHTDRLAAKLLEQQLSRQQQKQKPTSSFSQNDQMLASSSASQWARQTSSEGGTANSSASRMQSISDGDDKLQQPVHLITGTLSNASDLAGTAPQNMNEIVSNIMSSMGAFSSSSSKTNSSSGGRLASSSSAWGERERESSAPPTTTSANTDDGDSAVTSTVAYDKTDSESDVDSANDKAGATTGADNSKFERWLDRIKTLQALPSPNGIEAAAKRAQAGGPRSSPQHNWPQKANGALHSTSASALPISGEKGGASPPIIRAWPAGSGGRLKQHQKQQQHLQQQLEGGRLVQHSTKQQEPMRDNSGGVKGLPKRATQQQEQHYQQQQQYLQRQLDSLKLKYQSHPFQQQIRQQQTQLIHGIKYPSAQASTISVSTQEGASNTSLAFGSHYIPQINPMNSNGGGFETSQAVNLTSLSAQSAPPSPSNHHRGDETNSTHGLDSNSLEQQQNIYQSQDEILKQVTSAINFEQQQSLMNNQRKELSDKQLATGSGNAIDNNSNNNYMTPDGVFRFQNGTVRQNNSSTESGKMSQSPSATTESLFDIGMLKNISSSSGNSSSSLGSMDIDKSFDLLAERVRQLAASQQQRNSGNSDNQPSWLRPTLLGASTTGDSPVLKVDNLRELLASLNNNQQQQQKPGGEAATTSLDQIRELLQKHERTKNELKSSQETMLELMNQMMALKQLNASAVATPNVFAGNDSNRASSSPAANSALANLINDDSQATSSPPPPPMMKLSSGESAGQQQMGAAGTDSMTHPGASNIGWMPLSGQQQSVGVGTRAQQQQIGSPIPSLPPSRASPANLMKSRLKFPPHLEQEQQQQHQALINKHQSINNVGLMLTPQMAEELGDNELDQRIIGLPIALLNNDEVELSHGQLEEAARMAAEQLGAIPPQYHPLNRPQMGRPDTQYHQPQHLHHMHHAPMAAADAIGNEPSIGQRQRVGNNKFVARVAPNQVAQNRQQQADHLASVQKLLQSNSPQTFAQLTSSMSSSAAPSGGVGGGGQLTAMGRPVADSLRHHFHDELKQQRENLLQIEKLVSLLPTEQRNQLTGTSSAAQLDTIGGGGAEANNSDSGSGNSVESNRASGDSGASGKNSAQPRGETKPNQNSQVERPQEPSNMQQQQQDRRKQQQQPQEIVDPNLAAPVMHERIVGQYGQIPRPASESLMQEFRPLIGSPAYTGLMPPTHGLTMAANGVSSGGPLVTTTTITGADGPPIKMRELSIYRPFGFRGHHAVTYQASPAVAAMFPRLVASGQAAAHQQQQQASMPLLGPSGNRLTHSQGYLSQQGPPISGRPSILRHMTPIRATINESQRLISQIIPQQLAGHLGHYHHRYYHQYPTHTNLGTLPIPPMRQHHLISYPMRRSQQNQSQPPVSRQDKLNNGREQWRHKMARGSANEYVAPSRMQVRHLEPETVADKGAPPAAYSLVDEDEEHLFQVSGDEPFTVEHQQTIEGDDTNFGEHLVQQQLPDMEQQQHHQNGHRRSRPGRQMGAGIDKNIGRTSDQIMANRLSRLRVDNPVGLPITQPCLPIKTSYNTSMANATVAPAIATLRFVSTPSVQNLTTEREPSNMNKSTTTSSTTTITPPILVTNWISTSSTTTTAATTDSN